MTTTPTPPAPPTQPDPAPTSTDKTGITPSAGPLPHRPRLLPGLPVLRRTAGETQFGTDPRHAVVVSGLPDRVARLLHDLDGRHTAEELLARAGPDHHDALDQILRGLTKLGLLDDAAPTESPPGGPPPHNASLPGAPLVGRPARLTADRTAWALRAGAPEAALVRDRADALVVVYGSGRVAVAVAALLAASGVGWVHPVADGVVQPEDTGSGYLDEDIGRARGRAVERAVRRVAPETRTDQPNPRRQPALVVIADSAVPDPVLTASLGAARLPHLLAYAGEGAGVVGPLVVPGHTGCLRCANLCATEIDECWPALAAQLAVRPQRADLATAQATAAFAVGQVLRFLHGPTGDPSDLPTWGASVEVDIFTSRTRRQDRPAHPACVCGVARDMATESVPQPV